jgi:molybdenum cofactor synthesis domain-containing protein
MIENILTAGLLVIGDEILSGRTKDLNIYAIANFCTEHGLDLQEVRVISDQEDAIIKAVNVLRTAYTYVFTTGGIGATHDDITPAAIAKAFDRPYVVNETASNLIKQHYGDRLTETRLMMAYMPENVGLIDNPVSFVPSFYIENVFVLAGMPSVMNGMLKSVETKIKKGKKKLSNSLTSNVLEGNIGLELSLIQESFSTVSIGSYPFYDPPKIGTTIVIRSRDEDLLKLASSRVYDLLVKNGGNPLMELDVPFH